MKRKGLFITILSTMLLGVGVFAGVSSVSENAPVEKAEAYSKYDYDVFVDIKNSGYGDTVYCYNWGADATTWPGVIMTKVEGTIYGCNLKNSGNTLCIFNNGSGTKTGDLTVSKNQIFVMDSGTNGGWQPIDHIFSKTDYSASLSTMRLFINNSDAGSWQDSSQTCIRAWGSSNYSFDGAIYELNWFQNTGTGASQKWYGYADLPLDIHGWELVRCSGSNIRRVWNEGPKHEIITADETSRVYILSEYGQSWSWSSTKSDSAVGESFAAKILEAYSTCHSGTFNGYGAYTQLNTNFFSHLTTAARNSTCTSLAGKSARVSEHVAGMAASYGGTRATSDAIIINGDFNSASSMMMPAITATFVALAAGVGFLFFKKKKSI